MILDITPHIGVSDIKLGLSRTETRQVMNSLGFTLEHTKGSLDHYCESAIQLEFGDTDLLEHIGLAQHDNFIARYERVNVFDTEARTLFDLINSKEESPSDFDDYEHVFATQVISLWDSDEQYDRYQNESRKIWAAFGIGDKNYFEAISAIN